MSDLDVKTAVLNFLPGRRNHRRWRCRRFSCGASGSPVYVYDNGSVDQTVARVLEAGTVIGFEPALGKGHVVRRMFADVEADVYVMVDGDGTDDPAEAPLLVKHLVDGRLDMVAGVRTGVSEHAGRRGHAVGNKMFNRLYRVLFGSGVSDILTGCRVCLTRLVKSFPAVSSSFEVETERAVHVSQLRLLFAEVSFSDGTLPAGSASEPSPTSRGNCPRGGSSAG